MKIDFLHCLYNIDSWGNRYGNSECVSRHYLVMWFFGFMYWCTKDVESNLGFSYNYEGQDW